MRNQQDIESDENSRTSLEELCELANATSGADLISCLQAMSYEELDEILARYRQWALRRPLRAPLLKEGELRPYVPTDTYHSAYSQGGINGGPRIFEEHDATWRYIDQIKHRLIYCHSITIDDPVRYFLAHAMADRVTSQDARSHNRLANGVDFLMNVEALERDHVITFADFGDSWTHHEGAAGSIIERLEKIISNDDVNIEADSAELFAYGRRIGASTLDKAEKSFKEIGELGAVALHAMACHRIARAVTAASDYRGLLTPYLPFSQDIRLLGKVAKLKSWPENQRGDLAGIPILENRLMNTCVSLELPGISRLQLEDIKAIRESDQFGQWHETLRGIMRELVKLRGDQFLPDEELNREVQGELKKALDRIEGEISSKSSFLRVGGIAFAGGVASALIFYALSPEATLAAFKIAVAASSGTGLAAGIDRLIDLRKERSRDEADPLLQHFVSIVG